jgi:signal transduction histidine kinase/CheY-like chemotaxis protein
LTIPASALPLRKLLLFPSAIFLVIFAGILFTVSVRRQLADQERTREALISALNQQVDLIASEVYFKRFEALEKRFSVLLHDTLPISQVVFGCIEIETIYDFTKRSCNTGIELMNNDFGGPAVEIPVYVGTTRVADIHVFLNQPLRLSESFSSDLLISAFLALITAIAMFLGVESLVRRKVVDPLLDEIRLKSRDTAIVQTTQMLAHDVRRPFSIMKVALSLLENVKDPMEFDAILKTVKEEVGSSQRAVDSMLSDLLDIDRTTPLRSSKLDVLRVICLCVRDVLILRKAATLQMRYDIRVHPECQGDEEKLIRVLSNLFDNAVLAAPKSSIIDVKLDRRIENESHFLTISITNSGEPIDEKIMPFIFTPFYSSRVKGGTGLGLAVVKKIVEMHGGQVSCKSNKKDGTTFMVSLPCGSANRSMVSDVVLPISYSDAKSMLEQSEVSRKRHLYEHDQEQINHILEHRLRCFALERRIKILIIDDDSWYSASLKDLIQSRNKIADAIEVETTSSASAAAGLLSARHFDGVICDIDLGFMREDGLSFLKAVRLDGNTCKILMHSNTTDAAVVQESFALGADNFIPKPMNLSFLIRFIVECAEESCTIKNCD